LSEFGYSGWDFFACSLYMVPVVQYRNGIEYLGRAFSVPGLHRQRPIRFTVCLPVCLGEHTRVMAGTTRRQVTPMTPGTPAPGSLTATGPQLLRAGPLRAGLLRAEL